MKYYSILTVTCEHFVNNSALKYSRAERVWTSLLLFTGLAEYGCLSSCITYLLCIYSAH